MTLLEEFNTMPEGPAKERARAAIREALKEVIREVRGSYSDDYEEFKMENS